MALPIPPGPADGSVPAFTGSAVPARPVDAALPPQNPHLAANGSNSMHNDSYATDAYSRGGPLGKNLRVSSSTYGVEECATMAFDRHGRIVALCGGLEGSRLMLLDPDSLDVITAFPLPPRKPGTTSPLQDLCGGAYFYLDDQDRAVIETTNAQIWVVSEQATPAGTTTFNLDRTYDVSSAVPDADCLIALMPDWKGRIWFVTQQGGVGNVAPATGAVRSVRLPGEKIVNSFATDETGGVFIASDHALYRFDAGADGRPVRTWRQPYDRGSTTKPGQLSQGTGTTPTLIGKDLVVITDNADPRMHVLSYRRTKSKVTQRQVCKQAVFAAGQSDTENSPVAVGSSVVVENNYGYTSPQNAINGASSAPGLARVDVTAKGCRRDVDLARVRAVVGRQGIPRQRPALRVHQATRGLRGPVVLHRDRPALGAHRLEAAHRHRPAVEQPLRVDLPGPQRDGLHRHPRGRRAAAGLTRMSTYVVTGSASGIGAATVARLRDDGHQVIGVDRDSADVVADLATADGRQRAVDVVSALVPGGIAGLVPCAGIGGFTGTDSALVVSVNYFGAVEVAAGLRPLLARGGPAAVVMLSSNSITCQPGWATDVLAPCLAGDEPAARELANATDAVNVYPATKAALAAWVRREAVKPEWIGAGIRINAVAPGLVATAMTDQLRADPELGAFADAYPSALDRPGQPDEVADLIAFLLSSQASLLVGSLVYVDGGTDALLNP